MVAELAPEEVPQAARRNVIGEIVRANAASLGPQSRQRQQILRDIGECGTAAKGGRKYVCDSCGRERITYNSCRNRHCPNCLGYKSAAWLRARSQELLPVEYFHVVFTVPSELSLLALLNKKVVYSILFAAVSETLTTIAADPKHLGAEIGFLAILHTWSQLLLHHPHIHCVVPGGGIAPDGSRWISGRPGFFLPVRVLSRYYRRVFLERLSRAYEKGELRFPGELESLGEEKAFGELIERLEKHEWVVYSKPPFGSPEQVLKYLARYTHRVAISNRRILRFENNQVTFRYRESSTSNRMRAMTLDGVEFVRRLMLHTLPKGFVRIRHYGFLAAGVRREKLELCRALLGAPAPIEESGQAGCEDTVLGNSRPCPHCADGRFVLIAKLDWYELVLQKKVEDSS